MQIAVSHLSCNRLAQTSIENKIAINLKYNIYFYVSNLNLVSVEKS